MGILRYLAKRGFNYIDVVFIAIATSLVTSAQYVLAAICFCVGVVLSVAAEAISGVST